MGAQVPRHPCFLHPCQLHMYCCSIPDTLWELYCCLVVPVTLPLNSVCCVLPWALPLILYAVYCHMFCAMHCHLCHGHCHLYYMLHTAACLCHGHCQLYCILCTAACLCHRHCIVTICCGSATSQLIYIVHIYTAHGFPYGHYCCTWNTI